MEEYAGKKKRTVKFNINIFYALYLFLILIGKAVRYTLLKTVLVDAGIGHGWINSILYGSSKFKFWDVSEDTINTADAGGNAVVIYRFFNIFGLNTYGQFEVAITVVFSVILLILLCKAKRILNKRQMIFLTLSTIVLNTFCYTLSKEPIQMLYFIAIYAIIIANWGGVKQNMCIVVWLIITSLTFRSYYILVAMFYVVSQLVLKTLVGCRIKNKIIKILCFFIAMGLTYYVFLILLSHTEPDIYQELIRVRTRVGGARTDMLNILPSNNNTAIFCVDWLIMVFRMMFPIELLPMGVKYIPYVFFQLMISYFVIINVKNIKKNSDAKNLALYVYIGYLFASAAFEPDFGSWVRHEAVLFPVFLILTDVMSIKGYNPKQNRKSRHIKIKVH